MGYGIKGRNRILRSVSQKKISLGKKAPEAREGDEGSRVTRRLSKGLFDFIKIGNKWFSSRYNEHALTIKEEVNKGIPNINFLNTDTRISGDLIIEGSAPELTIQSNGTEDAAIQYSVNMGGAKEDSWQLGVDYSQQTGSDNKPSFRLNNSFVHTSSPVMEWDTDYTTWAEGHLHIKNGKTLRFYDSNNTNYVGFKTPATGDITADIDYTLPVDHPASNKILRSTSAGILSWESQGSGADGMGDGFIISDGATTQTVSTDETITFAAGTGLGAAVSATDTVTYSLAALAATKLYVGNVSNVATARALSGDVTMTNAGVVTIADDAVTEDKLGNTLLAEIDANTAKTTNATHSGDVTGSGALTIAADAVTYAKMQDVSATDRILGRDTSGAGIIEEITPANLRTMINVEDGATADQTQADINGLAITTTGIIGTGEWNATVIPSAKLDGDTAHLSGTQMFTGAKTFNTTTPSVTIQGDTITTAKDFSQLIITNPINAGGVDADHFHSSLEISIVDTNVGNYDQEGMNYIFCHNESTVGGGGVSRTPHFRVGVNGNVVSADTITSSNGVCQGTSVATSIVAGDGIDVSGATGDVTVTAETAAADNPGIVELATTAETTTGTDAGRAVTPDGLKDGYQGSANIVTTGALDSGSITSNFGTINNGASTITTTGTITGGGLSTTGPLASSRSNTAGAALTSAGADDKLINATQTLNVAAAAGGTQEYRMIKTDLTETNITGWDKVYLIDQQVGGTSKFNVKSNGTATFLGPVTSSNGTCSGTGALDTGSSNITTTGTVTTGPIVAGSSTITTSGVLTGSNGVCQGTKHKHFVTGLHRMRASADSKWYGGRNQDYYKQSEIWGLATTADLSGNFTDTAASAWATFIYADFVAPADCTVTAFSASVYQNSASSDVTLALWKGVVADEDNHSGDAAVDFVSKIAVTANADTSSIHASLDGSAIDATAGNLNKGDILFLAFKRDEASGDAQYYYFNWGIELTYG